MKKTFTFLAIIVFSFQLSAQHTLTQIRKPAFPGDIKKVVKAGSLLYAVGNRSGVRSFAAVSKDLGNTWNYTLSQPFVAKDNLTSVFFKDENNGWIGGAKGAMYKTTDGGNSWQQLTDSLFSNGLVWDIYFANTDTGYICGNVGTNGKVNKTVDGGQSWKEISIPNVTDLSFQAMAWENSLNGIVIGNSGAIMVTTDGGISWNTTANKSGSKQGLFSIAKPEAGKYFICGALGRILKSTDGGQSFNLLTTLESTTLYSIQFFNSQEGFLCGNNGAVYRTIDGGSTWAKVPNFTFDQLNSFVQTGTGSIVFAGNSGVLYHTDDNGTSWKMNTLSSRDFYSAVAKDTMNIIVAGGSSLESEVIETNDGGESWQRLPVMANGYLRSIFEVGNNLYVCGKKGSYYYSSNGGQTWEDHSIGGTSTTIANKLFFYDESNGYMTVSDGRIMKTSDKGATWTQTAKFTGEIKDIKMTSPTRGFAVGAGDKIYETFDGQSWSHDTLARPNVNLNALFLLDEQRGYVCGQNGAVYRTSDGFKTLALLTDTLALNGIQVNDLLAFNDSTVWAVADKGLILRSTSSNTIAVADTGYFGENLTSLTKLSGNSIIISSSNGAIYKLTDETMTVGVRPELKIAGSFELKQNYPNPFNPETIISYNLASAGYVRLKVFDILGKEVAVLQDGFRPAGNHSVRFNVLEYNLVSGIYFYRLEAGKFAQTRKMLLVK